MAGSSQSADWMSGGSEYGKEGAISGFEGQFVTCIRPCTCKCTSLCQAQPETETMCLNLRKTNEVSVPFAQGIGAASQSSCWVREETPSRKMAAMDSNAGPKDSAHSSSHSSQSAFSSTHKHLFNC